MPLQMCLLPGFQHWLFLRSISHVGKIIDSKDLRLLRRIQYHRILVDMVYRSGDEIDVLVPAEGGEGSDVLSGPPSG